MVHSPSLPAQFITNLNFFYDLYYNFASKRVVTKALEQPVSMTNLRLCDQDLLLLLQALGKLKWDVENLGNNVCRSEREPLRERDVGDAVRLVDLNPDEVFVASILDVVSRQWC